MINGNNELALALVVLIPIMYYLMLAKRPIVKYGLVFSMVACLFSALGSHSRGALLAIVACLGMLAMKSRKVILVGTLGLALLAGGIAFMPETR